MYTTVVLMEQNTFQTRATSARTSQQSHLNTTTGNLRHSPRKCPKSTSTTRSLRVRLITLPGPRQSSTRKRFGMDFWKIILRGQFFDSSRITFEVPRRFFGFIYAESRGNKSPAIQQCGEPDRAIFGGSAEHRRCAIYIYMYI